MKHRHQSSHDGKGGIRLTTIVSSDPSVIAKLWANNEAVLLERHVDKKTGLPTLEEWIVPEGAILWVSGARRRKTAKEL